MAKLTLREFTRQFPSKEEERRFTEAMNAPSDLIVAVLHGVELDYLLEQAISIKLERWDDETAAIISKDNGQISTFFAKIVLGYAMGLYDKPKMENLHVIRRIRNAFSHSRK